MRWSRWSRSGRRPAAGIAIEIHEPAPSKLGGRKHAAAGKTGVAKDATQPLSARWGLLTRMVDQPQFEFRADPERNPPSSPDKGYVLSWTVPGVELVWKGITAGSAIRIFRWNAKRKKVIGLPLNPAVASVWELHVESDGITQIAVLRPYGEEARRLLKSLDDGGLQWANQVFKDDVWTSTSTAYTVPRTPEWVARWQQWQARRREEARLAAEEEQRRQQAKLGEMLAGWAPQQQQEEAEADAEEEAERAQKAAAWNAMAAANEQALADSLARLNESAARIQAQQEQYRLQQQSAQQEAQTAQRQQEAENARRATQRQYEIAREFEARQQSRAQAALYDGLLQANAVATANATNSATRDDEKTGATSVARAQPGTGAPLRFVLSIGLQPRAGDSVNPTCYSNVITRPGPPGWGQRGFLPPESARSAHDAVQSLKSRFIAACRSTSGREVPSEGNFYWVWNETQDGDSQIANAHAQYREDVTVSL